MNFDVIESCENLKIVLGNFSFYLKDKILLEVIIKTNKFIIQKLSECQESLNSIQYCIINH